MSTTTQQPDTQRTGGAIQTFTVELGNARNSKITIDSLKQRFRGHFSLSKLHDREDGGRDVGAMQQLPTIPGIHLEIDAKASTVRIFDPLSDEKHEATIRRINKALENAGAAGAKFTSIKEVTRELTDDELKSLLLEIKFRIKQEKARLVNGQLPTSKQIESLPGEELFDPWSESRTQPRYKKDAERYYEQIDKAKID